MRAASKCLRCWIVSFGLILCVPAGAQTQSTGRLAGTVRDPQGAALATAKIEAENLASGERHSALCDDSGSFALLSLLPGTYHVTAQAVGFADASFPSITILLGDTTRLSITLHIAQSKAQVIVNDDPPLVRPDGVELETSITATFP
jgi:hypothetical protein